MAAAERYGDWYRDPWDWPELAPEAVALYDAEEHLKLTPNEGGEYHLGVEPHFHLIDVPKTRLGVRPAVVQDPASRLAYLSAVSAGLGKLHASLPSWVYGWRIRDGSSLSSGSVEWHSYVETLPAPDSGGYGLLTDLTSFFASVRPERLRPVLYARLGNVAATHVISDVIEAHDSLSTRSGLPQRSFASAALAHAVLEPLDDALGAAAESGGVTSVRRWMDDMSAEGEEEALFVLLLDLQERARQVGLELNASKTHIAPVEKTAATLAIEGMRKIRVPVAQTGGQYDDQGFVPDLDLLLQLEGALLDNPTSVQRTVARAVLVSLTEHAKFEREAEWRAAARHLPHAADALSRYLRGAAQAGFVSWADLGDWFRTYQGAAWGRLDWVSSQYATMFPADALPATVHGVLYDWLERSNNVQQIAIATQRLTAATPVVGRNLIRGRVDRVADPILLRILALGLVTAGDNRASVEAVLVRDSRNSLLLTRLNATDWKVPPVSKDFDASADDTADEGQ
jgi:hypothetical protein